jgi:hypothetical protein
MSNASTIALRVVGGDDMGTQCLVYNRATLFLGNIRKYEDLAPQVGGASNLRQLNVVMSSSGLGPVAIVNDRPILSSGWMLHKGYNRKCSFGK